MIEQTDVAHDLFLLLLNLSQLSDKAQVVRIFVQAVDAIWPGISLTYTAEAADKSGAVLHLDTVKKRYGGFAVQGDIEGLSGKDKQLLRNAVSMLALLLERLEQQERLLDSSRSLAGKVAEQTQELTDRHKELLHESRRRQHTEQALRHESRRRRILMQGSLDGIAIIDQSHKVVEANHRFASMLGYTDAEVLELHTWDFEAVLTEEEIRREFHDLTQIDVVFESLHRRKDGSTFPVEVSASGAAVGGEGLVFTITRDMSKRKQMEDALKQSVDMLTTVMDAIPADIYVMDPDNYEILFMNKGMQAAFGENLLGRPCWQVFRNSSAPCECCPLPVLLAPGAPSKVIWEDVNPITQKAYLNLDTLIHWTDGRLVKLQVATDVTDLRSAERALRESEQQFRLLAESMPQIVWICSPDGANIYFNQQWMDYTGLTLEESLGDGWNLPFHPDDKKTAWDAWSNATHNLAEYALDCRLRRFDGVYKWFLIRGVPVVDAQGAILKWFGTCTDIDTLKQTQMGLMHAKDAAEAASRAKSEFLANMSHEIRTPLNGVMGMLQLLGSTPLDPEQGEYVAMATKSVARLTRLLSDILDLSRVEAGKLFVKESVFEMAALRDSVLELLSLGAQEKGLELEFTIDEHVPPSLAGDEVRVRQILFNLVGNAIKFTEKGGVRIGVSRLPHGKQGQVDILFVIRDSGIGISDEMLETVFEPFAQAENSYTRRFQGAGLGLAIVRKLVLLLGGDLAIESEVGDGTTAYLRLPFKQTVPARPAPPLAACELGAPGGTRLKALLAEDDEMSLLAQRRMLEKLGFEVATAADGGKALAMLASESFDVVLMDIQMPVKGGVDTTRDIRSGVAGERNKAIPIVALTAYAMSGDEEKFLAAGMDGYIAKPVDMPELAAVIGRVLRKG